MRVRIGNTGKIRLRFIVIFVVISLVLALFAGTIVWRNRNSISRLGIFVDGDEDFTEKYSFPGSGTLHDPYRLENLRIDTDNDYGIKIRYVNSYFIIRNCFIKSTLNAIQLVGIESNYTLIEDNVCILAPTQPQGQYWYVCIDVYIAEDIEIKNNICECSSIEYSNDVKGITVLYADRVLLQNNTCNNMERGIGVGSITNNITIVENTCNSNLDHGLSVFHLETTPYYPHCIIANNTCLQNDQVGILVSLLSPSLIIDNNCSFNLYGGIVVTLNGNATITRNYLSNNTIGIAVQGQSNNATISYNHIAYSLNYGIRIYQDSYFHIIHHNNLITNYCNDSTSFQQAYDNCNNTWFNPHIGEGNFWDDLIWFPGAIYTLDGNTTTDSFPLENPVVI